MRFFFGYPPILFYSNLRVDRELREILSLKVLKSFANYKFRKRLHKLKVKINIIKRNVAEKVDEIYGLNCCCNGRFKQAQEWKEDKGWVI